MPNNRGGFHRSPVEVLTNRRRSAISVGCMWTWRADAFVGIGGFLVVVDVLDRLHRSRSGERAGLPVRVTAVISAVVPCQAWSSSFVSAEDNTRPAGSFETLAIGGQVNLLVHGDLVSLPPGLSTPCRWRIPQPRMAYESPGGAGDTVNT